MKPIVFAGSSLDDLKDFPSNVRNEIGHNLYAIQCGEAPMSYRPMPSIGPGVIELRQTDASGIYRVIYVAKWEDAVYVLHSFVKKTEKTRRSDIDLARHRLAAVVKERANDPKLR